MQKSLKLLCSANITKGLEPTGPLIRAWLKTQDLTWNINKLEKFPPYFSKDIVHLLACQSLETTDLDDKWPLWYWTLFLYQQMHLVSSFKNVTNIIVWFLLTLFWKNISNELDQYVFENYYWRKITFCAKFKSYIVWITPLFECTCSYEHFSHCYLSKKQ